MKKVDREIKMENKKKVIKVNIKYIYPRLCWSEARELIDLIPRRNHVLSPLRGDLIKFLKKQKKNEKR